MAFQDDVGIKTSHYENRIQEAEHLSRLEFLPGELIRIIFKMMNSRDLAALRLSSKTIRQLVEDEGPLIYKLRCCPFNLLELYRFSREVNIVKELQVRVTLVYEYSADFVRAMRTILESHREIKSLHLSLKNATDEVVTEMVRLAGPIIKHLTLEDCRPPPELEQGSLLSLETLNLDSLDWPEMNDQKFVSFLQAVGDNLKTLSISRISATGEGLASIERSLSKVTQLIIKGWDEVTNRGMSELLSILPNLREMDQCSGRSDIYLSWEGVSEFCKSLPKMTNFELRGNCSVLTDQGVSEIFSIMPNLKSFKIERSDLTGENVASLCKPLLDMSVLHLTECNELTSHGLVQFLSLMPNLCTLDLGLAYNELQFEGFAKLCKPLPKLTHLNISGCLNLTVKDLGEIFVIMPNLESIHLAFSLRGLSGELLSSLQSQPKLKRLVLFDRGYDEEVTTSLTAERLGEFFAIMPNLEHVIIKESFHVSGEGVSSFCGPMCNMKSLDLSECGNLTASGINEFVSIMPNLETFILKSNKSFSDSSFDHLKSKGINVIIEEALVMTDDEDDDYE